MDQAVQKNSAHNIWSINRESKVMVKKISKINSGESTYPAMKRQREKIIRNTFGDLFTSITTNNKPNTEHQCDSSYPDTQIEEVAIEINAESTCANPGIRHKHQDTLKQNAQFLVRSAQEDDNFPEHYKKCMQWAFKNADYDFVIKVAYYMDAEKRLNQNEQFSEKRSSIESKTEISYMKYLFDEVLQLCEDYKSPKQLIKESIRLLDLEDTENIQAIKSILQEALSKL